MQLTTHCATNIGYGCSVVTLVDIAHSRCHHHRVCVFVVFLLITVNAANIHWWGSATTISAQWVVYIVVIGNFNITVSGEWMICVVAVAVVVVIA